MLTDSQIRSAQAAKRNVNLTDSGGLRCVVTPAGNKLWQVRFRHLGKENILSLGRYPAVSLRDARIKRDKAKALLHEGRDPTVEKKLRKLRMAGAGGDTFEEIAREWHTMQRPAWSEVHWSEVMRTFERDVFPVIGRVSVRNLTPAEILGLLRGIEGRGSKETARRIRQRLSAVFVFAIASGRANADPAAIVQKAMAPRLLGRQPAVTDLKPARKVIVDAEAVPAHHTTKLALRLLAITAVRPGSLIRTPWSEFAHLDPDKPVWRIPASRLKLALRHKDDATRDLMVPLAPEAVAVIDVLRDLTGRGPYVFPSTRAAHKPMSENAIGYLLHRAGYHGKMVPHGWRSTFSTIMNEMCPADRHIIDLMLGHVPTNKVEAAYNRAAHLERRRELAALWGALICEGLGDPVTVLSGRCR
ncbi:MAG: phage integrase [Xanthobacteraceae bacterium]|nr:MAG: phage integrase [Xanthobacteraceae bacterium]